MVPKFVGYFYIDGWKRPIAFYSWYCDICKKMVVNYCSSHYNTLKCPLCIKRVGELNNTEIEVVNNASL